MTANKPSNKPIQAKLEEVSVRAKRSSYNRPQRQPRYPVVADECPFTPPNIKIVR